MQKIATQLELLMNAFAQFINDEVPTIIIEYTPADPFKGQPYPLHLYPDEARHVSIYIAKKALKRI